jgi:hypothetical protein
MLVKLEAQNWNAEFAYAPPLEELYVNPADVVSVQPVKPVVSAPLARSRFETARSTRVKVSRTELQPKLKRRILRKNVC